MVKQKPNFFFFLFSFCFPYFPFGAVQSIPDSRSINCAICNQFQVFLRCNQFQVPGLSTIFSFQVSRQKPVSQFRIIGIGSPGSRFAVLNLNSCFSSLIHLLIFRHVVVGALLSLLHLLLGGLPLCSELGGLPLRLLLLPLQDHQHQIFQLFTIQTSFR